MASPRKDTPSVAWLFDVYPHPKRSSLVVWIKHGNRIWKRHIAYQPSFCIKAEASPLTLAESLLAHDERVESFWRDSSALWLNGPPEEVLRVRPKRMQDLTAVATDLRRETKSKGFLFFDVDHQAESRWMHEHELFPMCRLHVDESGVPRLRPAFDEDRWTLHYPDPDLSTATLSVDVGKKRRESAFDDPLVSIGLGPYTMTCPTPGDPEAERATLVELGRRLRTLDPDVLLTRHGDRFDIPYLLRKIREHRLEHMVWLGRDEDVRPESPDQQSKSMHTYGRWLFKSHAYYLRGRWHVDLSKKTLDSEDDRKDLYGILYLTRIANRRAQDINRNGAGYALQQMQIDLATDMGVALPWKRNLAEDWKDAATLCAVDRGGQIMNPTPGLFEDVAACDFSGYYPSLVVRHNLSSDTINCACCPDGPVIPELNYHVCTKRYGHQAEILRRVWPHRRYVKAVLRKTKTGQPVEGNLVDKCKAIKSEHKAIGVVCFGYFRYRNARFGCAEVHQAIQCLGRAGMTRAREVGQAEGYTMVHTMTDCTFLHKPGVTRKDASWIARRITDAVGVPMDVEGVYKWVVFLPSKTHSTSSQVGVPNRYYGKFDDGTLKVRGIEVQRHSTSEWIYDVQQGMLDIFHEANNAAEFMERIPRALQVAKQAANDLRARRVNPESLAMMLQATKEVEEYEANTNTKAALLRLRDAGTERKPGEYVKYVVSRGDGPWEGRVVPVELFDQSAEWFGDKKIAYWADGYMRLLARSVETLLSPFGYLEDNVYEWLSGRAVDPIPKTTKRVDKKERPGWVAN